MVTFRAYVLVVYSLLLAGTFVVPTAIAANRVDILPARQHAVTPIQSINYNSVKIRCLAGENIPARFYGYMRVIDGEFIGNLEARIRDLETQFEQLEQ